MYLFIKFFNNLALLHIYKKAKSAYYNEQFRRYIIKTMNIGSKDKEE
jgi:hypothetical protein